MKHKFFKSSPVFKFQVEAIATVAILVVLGFVMKPLTKTRAGNLETPPTQEKQDQATSPARLQQREKQIRQIRPENYDLQRFPVSASHEKHWRHLLWTTAIVEPQETFVAESLHQFLQMTTRRGLSNVEVRLVDQAMKVATQLYLSNPNLYEGLGQRFVETVERSSDAEWVAVALSGLAKGKLSESELIRLSRVAKTRFPNWAKNVFLQTTLQEIADASAPQTIPPLKDLLTWEIAPKQLHLYVLCRPDRRILCRTVLKDRNGQFVTQGDSAWSIDLLLESIHRLNWNFIRGQTPQGIFRIEGTVPTADEEFFRAYGQFPLVNLFVPFEEGARQFLLKRSGTFTGSLQDYTALLPPSWQAYRPIQQTFWAGKAGRSLFRIHGSGEAVDFFMGKSKSFSESYNWNPTIGCLSARELYNEKGQLVHADMPKLLKALEIVGGKNFAGYLLVVDLPSDEQTPVSLQEITSAINPTSPQSRKGSPKATSQRVKSKKTAVSPPASQSKPAKKQPTKNQVLRNQVVTSLRISHRVARSTSDLSSLGKLKFMAPSAIARSSPPSANLDEPPVSY